MQWRLSRASHPGALCGCGLLWRRERLGTGPCTHRSLGSMSQRRGEDSPQVPWEECTPLLPLPTAPGVLAARREATGEARPCTNPKGHTLTGRGHHVLPSLSVGPVYWKFQQLCFLLQPHPEYSSASFFPSL